MKTWIFVLILSSAAQADGFKPVAAPKAGNGRTTNQDLPAIKGPSLNAGDRFEVGSYDSATRTYKLVLRADPSAGPLITTAENLAKAVDNIKLEKVLAAPLSIVRFDYSVAEGKELDLLVDTEVEARRAKGTAKAPVKGPEKPAQH